MMKRYLREMAGIGGITLVGFLISVAALLSITGGYILVIAGFVAMPLLVLSGVSIWVLQMSRRRLREARAPATGTGAYAGGLPGELSMGAASDSWDRTVRKVLREADVFRDLSNEHVDKLASLAQPLQVLAGWVLGKSDGPGEYLFIIREGNVQLSAPSAMGEFTVRIAGPGESFPLAILIGPGRLITSATALTDLELVAIPRGPLVALCSTVPEIGMHIYRAMATVLADRYKATLTHLATGAEWMLAKARFFVNL